MAYYHQGGWAEFASDLLSAMATVTQKQREEAASKQQQAQTQQADTKSPLDRAVDSVKKGAADAAKQRVDEKLSPLIWVAILYFLTRKLR